MEGKVRESMGLGCWCFRQDWGREIGMASGRERAFVDGVRKADLIGTGTGTGAGGTGVVN